MTGSATSECLPAELIVGYVEGTLAVTERATVESHTDGCTTCRVALSELAAGSLAQRSDVAEPGAPAEEAVVAPGDAIDRYLVLYRIGRGGMATVYAAYDPELDRKIALKILHGRGRRDHERLRREARTLAALTHPNVVAVFDVGEHGGLLFLAMELVEGQTLRDWLAKSPRTWHELAPVFVGAAHALAAAHAKGIVHRDVKPENLLLDQAGIVRVSDFGLAAISTGPALDTLAGTPAYMAPEQLEGVVGPESDQYSFCVTLYEALCGERPYGEPATRKPIAPFTVRGVPRQITDAVRRGISPRVEDRHASMSALASILAFDPTRQRRRIALGALAVAVVGGSVAISRVLSSGGAQCEVSTDRWSVTERDAVHHAFAATKHPAAEPAFAAVDRGLATYLDAWSAMSTESCERTRVRGDQSDALLDLRTHCLDQRLAAAGALIDVLANAKTPAVVEGAVNAVAGLPPIAGCADVNALTSVVPRPQDPAVAAKVDALQARLGKAAALQLTGQYAAASAIVTPALPEAVAIDYAPLLAQARWLDGDLQYRAGDYPASAAALREAVSQAARGRDDRTATRALTLLAGVVGYVQGKPDEGMALALDADAWSARAGRIPEDEAELADIRGLLHDAKGEPLLARPYYERALALREKLYGGDHLMVALSLNNLAGVPYTLGKYEEARKLHERAREIRERVLGPVSSDLAVSLNAIAAIDENEDKLDDAERGFRRAISIWQTVLGPDHPDVAAAHNNLGNLLRTKKDYPKAIVELERALAIWSPAGGNENPNATSALGNLAITYYEQKDYPRALTAFTTVIDRMKKTLGENHPSVAKDLVNRGQTLDAMGRHADANADLAAAVKMFEASVPAGDRRIAWALTIFGKHEIQQKRIAPAVAALTRALAILEADKEARPEELAAARFALARAKWEAGDRKTALELARASRAGTSQKQVVDDWLQARDK
jgi:tetratricopeptide (TPR) repeat protein